MKQHSKRSWAWRGTIAGGGIGALGSLVIFVLSFISPDGALVLMGSYVLGLPLSHWLIYSIGVPPEMQVPVLTLGMAANGAVLGVGVSGIVTLIRALLASIRRS